MLSSRASFRERVRRSLLELVKAYLLLTLLPEGGGESVNVGLCTKEAKWFMILEITAYSDRSLLSFQYVVSF